MKQWYDDLFDVYFKTYIDVISYNSEISQVVICKSCNHMHLKYGKRTFLDLDEFIVRMSSIVMRGYNKLSIPII